MSFIHFHLKLTHVCVPEVTLQKSNCDAKFLAGEKFLISHSPKGDHSLKRDKRKS